MTSWVLAISRAFPDHWEVAKTAGFWDMRSRHGVKAGDVVYFWLSGESFVGRVDVVSDAQDIEPTDRLPWRDAGTTAYRQRFYFANFAEPRAQPRWAEVKESTGFRQGPNFVPRSDEPPVEHALRAYFQTSALSIDKVDFTYANMNTAVGVIIDSDTDDRERAVAAIKLRRGQSRFRQALLTAYDRCAVTGTAVTSVLEAAHISPYRGDHTNLVQNGLLLRADVHVLFDVHQLTVEAADDGFVVRTAPELRGTSYGELDGARLHLPADPQEWPALQVIRRHNKDCAWLEAHR